MQTSTPEVTFDKKYKTVIEVGYSESYIDIIYWLDQNTNNSVDVKHVFGSDSVFVGFENSDDALLFKIRFSK